MAPHTTQMLSRIVHVLITYSWILATRSEAELTLKEYHLKAQCQARCNGELGMQPQLEASEFFDVYPSYVCRDLPYNCSQCSLPCSKFHNGMENCSSLCESDVCRESCHFLYTQHNATSKAKEVSEKGRLYLTKPVVTCTYSSDVHMSYLRWNMREQGNNRSSSVPLCFLVELQVQHSPSGVVSQWRLLGKTNFSFIPVKDLEANTKFRFRVTAVSRSGQVDRRRLSEWAHMPAASASPKKPELVQVVRQEVRHGKVSALVMWKPARQGGCFFKLYWMGDGDMKDSYQVRHVPEWPEFKYELTNLMFGRNYTVEVHSFNRRYTVYSEPTSVRFQTITCLDHTNYSYVICKPDPPRNLTVELGEEYFDSQGRRIVNATLSWLTPMHASSQNRINKFVISWHKKPLLPISELIEAHHGETTSSGQVTSLLLPGLHTDSRYEIRVKAVAGGGNTSATHILDLGTPYKDVLGMGGNVSTSINTRLVKQVDKNVYVLALLPACLACGASLVYYLYRRYCRRKSHTQERLSVAKQELNPLYGSVGGAMGAEGGGACLETDPLVSPDHYEIELARLTFVQTLGEGAFGKVMRADLDPPPHRRDSSTRTVAVKILKDHATADERRSLLLEIEVMKQFGKHQNVVSMLGCCTTGPRICLVMDFCPLGDLRHYLREYREKHLCHVPLHLQKGSRMGRRPQQVNSDSGISQHSGQGQGEYGANGSKESRSTFDSSIPSCDADADVFIEENFINQSTLLSYARQIALGMEFLSQKKFVHRDLAARNILVHNHRLLKISDFGLSRDVYETNVYQPTSGRKLPYKWMPLESIFDHKFTTKSDVWSFGIVLWEIVTLGGCPYPGIPNRDLFRLLKDGYRMEKPDNCSHEIYQMMLTCWHPRPEDRPCFAELRYKLESLLEATRSYIDLSVNVSPDYYTQDSSDDRGSGSADKDRNTARVELSTSVDGLAQRGHGSVGSAGTQEHSSVDNPVDGIAKQEYITTLDGNNSNLSHLEKDVTLTKRAEGFALDAQFQTERQSCWQLIDKTFIQTDKLANSQIPVTSEDSESGTECSFQSQENVSEVMSDYELEPDTDSNSSDNSVNRQREPMNIMKAPSLRNGMMTLLGKMAERGKAARFMNPKHSLSMSEVFSLSDDDSPEHFRSNSSGYLI